MSGERTDLIPSSSPLIAMGGLVLVPLAMLALREVAPLVVAVAAAPGRGGVA
jgi:hypothetical protein